jgi:hypothetical protein
LNLNNFVSSDVSLPLHSETMLILQEIHTKIEGGGGDISILRIHKFIKSMILLLNSVMAIKNKRK